MIFITGASGFVGKSVIEKLQKVRVRVLSRESKLDLKSTLHTIIQSGLEDDLSQATVGVECVIHCAGISSVAGITEEKIHNVNCELTLKLARQCINNNVKRFIFISSVKVCGENSGDIPFSVNTKCQPEDAYARSKLSAERGLISIARNTGMEVVIIRPTLVYGPGVKANFASLMNLVSKGFPLPFGIINSNQRSLVSVTNLVDLIVTCIEHPKAKNQVFLVSDDHDVSTSEMVKQMSVACGKKNFQLPVPAWCYKFVGKLFKKEDVVERLIGSLQVDISYTKETLDWTPPQPLQDGFKETADYFLNKRGNK